MQNPIVVEDPYLNDLYKPTTEATYYLKLHLSDFKTTEESRLF